MLAIFNRAAPVEIPTLMIQPIPAPPAQDEVLALLRDIARTQVGMDHRLTRIESRLVGMLLANGLDRNGKPRGEG